MKSLLVALILLVAIITVVAVQAAPLERQHGAHVHGQANGTLAVDNGRLSLSLVVPGVNLVGFEHPPSDDDQRQRLDKVEQALESGDWLTFDSDGDCRIESSELAMPGFAEGSHDHDEHHHDHHHHDHNDHEHAEFHVDVDIACIRVGRLGWIELNLFEDYPGNEKIRMDVLRDTRAERLRLTPGDTRIRLP